MIVRYTWSGDIASCCRSLEFDITCIAGAVELPQVEIDLGDRIAFYAEQQLFDGFVVSIQKATGDRSKTIRCVDRGFYLNQNQGYYRFRNTTPEVVAKTLSTDFSFSLGDIVSTGHKFSRNFLGQSIYKILATGYTLASAATGDKYHIGFELDRLCVRKKQQDANTLVIKGGSNLLSSSVTESIERLINRVQVVDKSHNLIATEEDTASIRAYGVLQNVLQQSDDSAAKAKKLLADNGPTQKITLDCVGDIRSVTGRMVAVQESHTGLWGLFWIDSDTHTWSKGVYTNKLVINFKNIMDEQEVGTLESTAAAAASKSASDKKDSAPSGAWAYYRE